MNIRPRRSTRTVPSRFSDAIRTLFAALACVAALTPAHGQSAERGDAISGSLLFLVDFEGFDEGTDVFDQYADQDVLFGIEGDPDAFPTIAVEGSPQTAFSGTGPDTPMASGSAGITAPDGQNIEISFTSPVTSARFFIMDIDGSESFTARAFDGTTELDMLTIASGDENTGNGVSTQFFLSAASFDRIVVEASATAGYALDFITFTRTCAGSECGPLIEIAQESAPGAGDFDDNILGTLLSVPFTSTTADFFAYDVPEGASWNGQTLTPVADRSHLVFAENTDGLSIVVIHDRAIPDDPDGGIADMTFELMGDPDGAVRTVEDDPGSTSSDSYTGADGDSFFTTHHEWSPCCTDGVAYSDLDGEWSMLVQFTGSITGLNEWVAYSADGTQIPLELESDRRIRARVLALPDIAPSNPTAPSTAFSGENITVTWDGTNAGDIAATGSWTDRLYLSTDMTLDVGDIQLGESTQNGPLLGGDTYNASVDADLPMDMTGQFFLLINADDDDTIDEGPGEANNLLVFPMQIDITTPPAPDLQVTNIEAPCPPVNGQIPVTYAVTNSGDATATGPWTDRIILTDDDTIGDADDIEVATYERTSPLGPGENYTAMVDGLVDEGTMGTYTVAVITDANNDVQEFDGAGEDNNELLGDSELNLGDTDQVTLFCWMEMDYAGNGNAGNWNIASDGLSVTQTINGDPTFFISNFDLIGSQFRGQFQVLPGAGDDDYIGLVFGFQGLQSVDDGGGYYIFTWKRGNQGAAEAGFKLIKIIGDNPDLWDAETEAGQSEVLVRQAGNNADGWDFGVPYDFLLTYQADGNIRVVVQNANTSEELFNTGLVNDPDVLGSGKVGFYNFSQSQVNYAGFTSAGLVPPTADAGGPYSLSATMQDVTVDASGSTDPDSGGISAYQWDLGADGIGTDGDADASRTNEMETITLAQAIAKGLTTTNTVDLALEVTDLDGLTGNDTTTIGYTNSAPTADAGGPYSPLVPGESLTLAGVADDDDLAIEGLGESLTVEWDIEPAMGAGDVGDGFASTADASVSYGTILNAMDTRGAEPTGVTIYLNVADASGAIATDSVFIDLAVADLVATADPLTNTSGLADTDTFTFDWTVSNDGVVDATGPWSDRVYASADATFDETDTLLGTFSAPVSTLAPGEMYSNTQEITFPSNAGTYFIIVVPDGLNDVPELQNEGDFAATPNTLESIRGANLRVTSVLAPLTAAPGSAADFRFTIRNTGNAPANGPFTNTVIASTDQTQGNADDVTALTMTFNGTINPGESVQFVEQGTVPMEPGPYFAFACADTDDDIDELDEADNCRITVDAFTVGAADLIIASDTAPSAGTINEDFTVQWTVRNDDANATAIAPWTDRVFFSDDNILDAGDTPIGESVRSANLAPGDTYTASASSTWPITTGDYFIIINTDDDDTLEELENELNNTRVVGPIAVSDPPLPDLEVTAVTGPSVATGGDSINIEYTVTNTGTHPASSNWQDAIYLSDDDTLDDGDTTVRLDPLNEAPLASGESYGFSRSVTLPVSFDATTAYVIVETDANNVLEERFEDNNVAVTMPIEVTPTPAPDLLASNVDGPSSAMFGADVTVSWQVTNDGTETATATWSDLVFLSTDETLESGDRFLGSVPRDDDLEPGNSYMASGTFELPLDTQTQPGTYFFIVAADGFQGITENNEDNNASASMPVNVDLPPLPNLRVQAVMSPSAAEVGEPITVAYRIANEGTAEASGSWLNEIRLIPQSNAESDTNDATRGAGSVVAVDAFSGSIPAGGTSDVLEATFNLPNLPADAVIASVETDVDGQIVETDETDNTAQAALPTTYLRPDLVPVSINPPATALADETIQLTIGIDNTGSGRARPFWVDAVLLSFDDQIGNDVLLGIDSQTTQVLAGESYAQIINVTLPGDIQGNYWFVAQTDRTQRVRELDETNNRLIASAPTMVEQPPRPDLQVTSVATPNDALSSSAVDVSWTVTNTGDAQATGFWVDRVYLSSDPTLSDDDQLIDDFASANPLMPGESYTTNQSIVVPSAPGTYFLLVETDANATLNEGLEGGELNNTGASAGTFSIGTFTATANADIDSAPAGTPAQITGLATVEGTSDPAPFVTLDVRVIRSGFLRRFTTMTDENGQYNITFTPGPTEGGLYEVAAGPSHVSGIPAGDAFSLWSITAGPREAFVTATPNIERQGSFRLKNQGNQPITGLTPTVTGVPEGVDVMFDFDISRGLALGPNETITIGYTILATEELSPFLVDVDFTADQPATANFDLNIRVLPAQPSLTLLPTGLTNGRVTESLIRGDRTYAEFSFRNDGGAPTGTLQVQLPEIDWISLSTTATIPPIQPGQIRTVVLQLDPPMDQPFGELTGGVVVTDGTVGITAPFRFTIISDEVGSLEITATDEFTYYDEAGGFPNVAGATVEVIEPDTNNLVASGLTDSDGRIRFDGLTAGFYNVRVREPDHGNFQTNILVQAADLTELEAFLPRQVVNYTWSVIPIDFEDEYTISIEAEFETNVPAPVVTIEPASLDLQDVPFPTQVDFTITNHGLITADNVRLQIGQSDVYDAIPLVEDIGDLAGMSSVTVPVIITEDPTRGGGCGSITVFECHDLECGDTTYTYCAPSVLYDNGCPPASGSSTGGGVPSGGGGGFTGGGGSPFDGGPPISWQPTQSQPIACNPCVPRCAGSGLGCIPGAGCPVGLGTCAGTFDASSAGDAVSSTAGCIGAGINCVVELTPLAGQLSCLCSVLRDCALCNEIGPGASGLVPCSPGDLVSTLGSIIGGAIGRGDDGQLMIDIPESGNPEADYFRYYYFAYLSSIYPLVEIFGDIAWIEPLDNNNYDSFMAFVTAWQATADPASPQGQRVSQSERDSLAMSLPPYADESMLDAFIERWNRSLDYYDQGIMTEADLPAGVNPDFIDFEIIRVLVEFAAEAEDRAIDEQFRSVNDALQYAEQTLVLDVTDGGDGVCATVRIQLDQQLTVTRTAFQATLELENATAAPLESIGVNIRITDEFGNEATDRFGIFPPELSGALTAVDGTGTLPGNGIGESNWVILPTNEAAPIETTEYFVAGSFTYDQGGSMVTVPLAPASITVMPDPSLQLKYFLETIVFADDPFTPQLEPSIPFNLGLLVKNNGAGVARDLTITSSQPEIVENDRGLLIDFDIIGTEVGDEEISPSLTVNLGDIGPEETNVARWLMISTLQGEFVSYSASYEHITGLGDPRLSVIESVDIFGLNHVVKNTTPSGDNLPDFLTNDFPDPRDLPDRVHLSENGAVEEVNTDIDPPFTSDLPNLSATVNATLASGWNYVRIDDPFDGSYRLASVERSDGSPLLMPYNAWQTSRIDRNSAGSPVERFIHIFDNANTAPGDGQYTLTFDPDNEPPQALAIQSVIEHDNIGEVGLTLTQGEPASEPRGSGIRAIIYTFNEPLDAATFNEATVLVDGTNVNTGDPVDLSSVTETVTLTTGDTVGEIRFDPPLPFPARYCVQLAGVSDRAGNVVSGDAVRLDLAALPGDATGDRRVNNTDVGGIASLLGTDPIDPMSLFEVRSDLNTDGKIDMDDLTIALSERGADARFTKNPCLTRDETPNETPNNVIAGIPNEISPNPLNNNTGEAQDTHTDDDADDADDSTDSKDDGPALAFNVNGRDHVYRIDTDAIALFDPELAPGIGEMLTDFGITPQSVTRLPRDGWWIADLPASLAEGMQRNSFEKLLSRSGIYTSPVLIAEDGASRAAVTSDLLITFREDIPADWARMVIETHAGADALITADAFGRPGFFRIDTGALTGQQVLDLANRFAEREDVDIAEADMLAFATATLAHKGEIIEHASDAPADIALLAASNASAGAIASHARPLMDVEPIVAPFRAFDTRDTLISATTSDLLRALTRAEAASPRVTFTEEAFAFPSNLIAAHYQSMADAGVAHVAPEGGFPATLGCVTTVATSEQGADSPSRLAATALAMGMNEPSETTPVTAADLDGNGTVDINDLAIFMSRDADDATLDLNGDGIVNEDDLAILLFNQSAPAKTKPDDATPISLKR